MGLANVTFVDALISERHSAGIELIILIRKNLCSGFVSEEKSHEKSCSQKLNLSLSLLHLFCTSIFCHNKESC